MSKVLQTRKFWQGFLITFSLGLLYLFSAYHISPGEYFRVLLVSQPNYSVFYIVFFPLAVGLFYSCVNYSDFKNKSLILFVPLIIFLVLVFPLTATDAYKKAAPHSPISFSYNDSQSLIKAIECESEQRDAVINNKQSPDTANSKYLNCMGDKLGVTKQEVAEFSGFSDLLERGSFVTIVDFMCSLFAGIFVVLYLWYLLFLLITRQEVSEPIKNRLILSCIFLLTWIPMRLYSIWYQNFFELTKAGDAFLVLSVVAIALIVLLLFIFRPGPLMATITAGEAIASGLLGYILKFNPENFGFIQDVFGKSSLIVFISIESVAFFTLLAVVNQYVDIFDFSTKKYNK